MLALARSLSRNRRLLGDFVVRDLRGRYIGSSMGFFWSVVYPFLNLFIYMFVFGLVLKVRFSDEVNKGQVALWMLAGITVWAAFGETISRSTNTLVENQNLIQKVVFPSEILPSFLCISSLINMCIGLPIVILGVLVFVNFPNLLGDPLPLAPLTDPAKEMSMPPLGLGWSLLALPLLMALQAIFTVGIGYFLAALNLFLRDVYHLMGVFVTVWMFATPIFYPPQKVVMEGYGWILAVNPMHWLISCYREVLIFGAWPDWLLLAKFAAIGVVLLFLGSRFFLWQKPQFPDLL
ncbi:MAG TPA: ABC transporter permease [Planctomycetota bacterium]|nr:ABC transporter permease [Planctomycetota bacterium]